MAAGGGEDQNDGADWGYKNDEAEVEQLATQDFFIGMANSTKECFKVETYMERVKMCKVSYLTHFSFMYFCMVYRISEKGG